MGLFATGSSIQDVAKDAALGGASGFGGRYIYDKVIGGPLNSLIGKNFGKYADIASSYVFDLALNYLSQKQTGMIASALQVAGYVPFADALGVLAGDAPPAVTAGPTKGRMGNPYGGLTPISLGRGSGGTTSPR